VPTVEPEGLSDPEVLELTAAEGRVLVTASLRDFEPISREWALAATDILVSRGPGSTHRLRQFSDSSKNARRSASEPVSSSRRSLPIHRASSLSISAINTAAASVPRRPFAVNTTSGSSCSTVAGVLV
jgi:hypothetical protein